MKRFLVDWHYANNMPDDIQVAPATGKSVAVIGAGPAGLSAASSRRLGPRGPRLRRTRPAADRLIGVPAFRLRAT